MPAATGGLVWPAASRAIYMPITLPFPYTIERMFWHNGGTPGSNHYVGIYGFNGAYIWRGTAVGSGANSPQYVAPPSPIQLSPGRYFVGYSLDSTTANRAYGITDNILSKRLAGVQEGTVDLPTSTPTFVTCNMTLYPVVGFTNTKSGY